MRKIVLFIAFVLVGLTLATGLLACSGQSRDVVVVEQQDQNVDPQTKAMQEQMMKLLQQSRQMTPPTPAAQPQQAPQNKGN